MKWLKPLIMFLTGYCVYVAIEVTYRGYSSPLMGILGGCILIALDNINNSISWDMDLMLQGVLGSIIVTCAELLTGSIINVLGWTPIWDYSNLPLNYNGVICLPFSIIWVFVSILGIFIADGLNYYLFEEEPVPYYHIGKKYFKFKEKHCKLR